MMPCFCTKIMCNAKPNLNPDKTRYIIIISKTTNDSLKQFSPVALPPKMLPANEVRNTVIEIDNDERGVIRGFTTMSNIRITNVESE